MDVGLARMCFAATAIIPCWGLKAGKLSQTSAVALQVLIGGADLAALNNADLTGRTQKWTVDKSASFHLVTTVFMLYAPRLKPKVRARMLQALMVGDTLHALARGPSFGSQAAKCGMPVSEAYRLLEINSKSTADDICDHYVRWRRHTPKEEVLELEQAYKLVAGITTTRSESFAKHFKNADGTPLFEYPKNGNLDFLQTINLDIRYWQKKQSTSREQTLLALQYHYVWITGAFPPETDPN